MPGIFGKFFFACLIVTSASTKAQMMTKGECQQAVAEMKKNLPIDIDAVTKRVNVACSSGVTKPVSLEIFDEFDMKTSTSDQWVAALNDPEKKNLLVKAQCQVFSSTGTLKHADMGYNLKVNGVSVGRYWITEKACSDLGAVGR